MAYAVLDNWNKAYREGFVISESELDKYSLDQYFIVRDTFFADKELAEEWCQAYNEYMLDDDPDFIECDFCPQGCFLSAFDWAHWNGTCPNIS